MHNRLQGKKKTDIFPWSSLLFLAGSLETAVGRPPAESTKLLFDLESSFVLASLLLRPPSSCCQPQTNMTDDVRLKQIALRR